MKKRHLNKRGKIALTILYTIIICLVINFMINNMQRHAQQCDNAKGAMCSIYEVQQYARMGGIK